MIHFRLICRTDKLSGVDNQITMSYQTFSVKLLKRNPQAYWKDDRCTEVDYELSSSISLEQWYQFFCSVFGTDNNTVEEDGRALTHNGSPILNDTEVFAYLFIAEQN